MSDNQRCESRAPSGSQCCMAPDHAGLHAASRDFERWGDTAAADSRDTEADALMRLREAIAARDAKARQGSLGPYGFEEGEIDPLTEAVLAAAYALATQEEK